LKFEVNRSSVFIKWKKLNITDYRIIKFVSGKIMRPNNSVYKLSLVCLLLGAAGILISSHNSTYVYSEPIFIVSSLLLGVSLLVFLFTPSSQPKKEKIFITLLLFLIAIVKVIGLHIKYGMYLGCDSVAEFLVIKLIYLHPSLNLTLNALTEFPLSYIFVYTTSAVINVYPISGSWNFIHLVTNALTVVLLYLLIESLFNRDIAIISCITYMYNPAVSIYTLSMTRENFGILFLVASIYVIQTQAKKSSPSGVFVYIIFAVSLLFSHYTTAYFSLVILVLLFSIGSVVKFLRKKSQDFPKYKNFHVLFFSIILFMWVFYTTYHHQTDIHVADNMLRGIADLFQTKEMQIASNRETAKIISDFSMVQVLYKLQGFYIALGSLYLLVQMRKTTGYQLIFAIVALMSVVLITLSAFMPSLADSLSPTRIMRFGIVLGCISVGYMTVRMKSRLKSDNHKIYKIIVLMVMTILFIYPISQWIATEYMSFTNQPYPYELRSEMYNIRSTHEVNTIEQIYNKLPENNSTLAVEMPLATLKPFLLFAPESVQTAYLNDSILFGKEINNDTLNSYIFMRRSLYENRQLIEYPENWRSASSFLRKLNNTEFIGLRSKIENNYILYDEGSYKLIKIK
jgi:uncharacterized membrane protein